MKTCEYWCRVLAIQSIFCSQRVSFSVTRCCSWAVGHILPSYQLAEKNKQLLLKKSAPGSYAEGCIGQGPSYVKVVVFYQKMNEEINNGTFWHRAMLVVFLLTTMVLLTASCLGYLHSPLPFYIY